MIPLALLMLALVIFLITMFVRLMIQREADKQLRLFSFGKSEKTMFFGRRSVIAPTFSEENMIS